ncbi:MAG TPA: SH3 domain-containing protein [Oceanobacillus sp.]|nr:SH3 domain-containing protein [Oceanobacillus sp.]
MSKRLTLLLLLLIAIVPATLAQEEPPPPVVAAVNDLSSRLGQTVTNYNYNFEQFNFPDNTMNCPTAPVTPTQGTVSGYEITITFQGTDYSYRANTDGSVVFPCDETLLGVTPGVPAQEPTLGGAPTVDTAATTCPSGFAGFLMPRVNVGQQARVTTTSGVPNRLRNAPTTNGQQIGEIAAGQQFDIVGGPACADGIVWWQVSVGGQTGWTAEGLPPDIYYLEPMGAVAATAVSTNAGLPETTFAPETTTEALPDFAALADNAIGFYDFSADGVTQLVVVSEPLGEQDNLGDLGWSFSGDTLGYALAELDETTMGYFYNLYVTDANGSAPVQVATGLYFGMPVAFRTQDGSEVIYAKSGGPAETNDPNSAGAERVQVFAQPVDGTAESALLLGEFTFGLGCGGGSPYPADFVYMLQAGYGGRGLILQNTPAGLLHSTNCTGSGTGLLNLQTGESTELSTNLSRVSVSPDGNQIVGIADEQPGFGSGTLTVVDLTTLEATPLTTTAAPDQVAFGADGYIYYSVRERSNQVVAGSDAATDALRNFGIDDSGLVLYNLAIYRIRPDGTDETLLFEGTGHGVGQLLPAPDGSFYFNVVPSGEAWVQAITSGELTMGDVPAELVMTRYFPPTLYRVAAGETTATPVADGLMFVALNPASFPPTGPA